MTIFRASTAVLVCLLTIAAGCSSGGSGTTPEPKEPVELTVSGGCGDAFVWATTPKGDLAVTVTVDARDRSADEPTTVDFDLPDADATVEVLRGKDLAQNFCNDVAMVESEPEETQEATAGSGSITLDAPEDPGGYENCGSTSGRLQLEGLVAEDGTTFAPIDATTDQIGCYAG